MREKVLMSQDAMRVLWFTREGDERWSYPEGVCRLERLGVTLGLGRIYRKVAGVS